MDTGNISTECMNMRVRVGGSMTVGFRIAQPWNFARLLVDIVERRLGVLATLLVCFGPWDAVRPAALRVTAPACFFAPATTETEPVLRPVTKTRVSPFAHFCRRARSRSLSSSRFSCSRED